jgi:hypothetical protein
MWHHLQQDIEELEKKIETAAPNMPSTVKA